jgi:putative transposase
MDVVVFAVHLYQFCLKIRTHLGEDMPQSLDSLAVENASAVFGHEDQMYVHGKNTVSTVPKVLAIVHRPEHTSTMERRQAYQFELMQNGEQERLMRRTAGCVRFIYNKALALQKEMYELCGKKHTRYQLNKLLSLWKVETLWLAEVPSHALQQALVDLDRSFTNFFKKRTEFPKFHKKGQHSSFRESDPKCITLDQANSRVRLPKIGWVRYRNSREVLGTIRNVTVSESLCGKRTASSVKLSSKFDAELCPNHWGQVTFSAWYGITPGPQKGAIGLGVQLQPP